MRFNNKGMQLMSLVNVKKLCTENNIEMLKKEITKNVRQFKLNELFAWNCRMGNIKIAKAILNISDKKLNIHHNHEEAFRGACRQGHLNLAKWLYNLGGINTTVKKDYAFRSACVNGHLEIAKWLTTLNIREVNEDLLMEITIEGKSEILKWLWAANKPIFSGSEIYFQIFWSGCLHGHLDIAKWIITICHIGNFIKLKGFNNACSNGHLVIVEWLYKNLICNVDDIMDAFKIAYDADQIEICKWFMKLRKINPGLLENHYKVACKNGNIEYVKLFMDYGLNSNILIQSGFYHAAWYNKLNLMKWFYETFKIDIRMGQDYAIKVACTYKYTDIIIWLVAICPDYEIENKNGILVPKILNIVERYLNGKCNINDICNYFGIVTNNDFKKLNEECSICYCEENNQLVTSCRHNYCGKCLMVWINKNRNIDEFTCPYCMTITTLQKCILVL